MAISIRAFSDTDLNTADVILQEHDAIPMAQGYARNWGVEPWRQQQLNCQHLNLEGLVQYYFLTGDPRVGDLLTEIEERLTRLEGIRHP